MHVLDQKKVGPLVVKIVPDEFAAADNNPAQDEWDNGIRFVTFERNSTLSDLHNFGSPEEAVEDAELAGDHVFPLYRYEHSLVSYNVTGYSCPWDSGQVGFVFIPEKEATGHADARRIAEGVCQDVTDWCNGNYVGFVVENEEGETLDSCWGFSGRDDYALAEGVVAAEYALDKIRDAKARELEDSRPDLYNQIGKEKVS